MLMALSASGSEIRSLGHHALKSPVFGFERRRLMTVGRRRRERVLRAGRNRDRVRIMAEKADRQV
jgi:hypothetical protein